MAQAKRRNQSRNSGGGGPGVQGLGILLTGIVIGSLGTIIWQGTQTPDDGIGAGLRQMMEESRDSVDDSAGLKDPAPTDQPQQQQQTSYDFFTVLPEIEVVVPPTPEEEKPKPEKSESDSASGDGESPQTADAEEKPATDVNVEDKSVEASSAYMLQAGSYRSQADAEKMKAQLALIGHGSTVQKVTIQGQGDFYRVRLGPFVSHDAMVKADQRLSANGIKSLRLKVSKGG